MRVDIGERGRSRTCGEDKREAVSDELGEVTVSEAQAVGDIGGADESRRREIEEEADGSRGWREVGKPSSRISRCRDNDDDVDDDEDDDGNYNNGY